LTIGELAEKLGTTTRTLRYYEELGLVPSPEKQPGGSRLYGKEDIVRLEFILKLKQSGVSLREINEIVKNYGQEVICLEELPKLLNELDLHISNVDQKIANLLSLRKYVANYRSVINDKITMENLFSQ